MFSGCLLGMILSVETAPLFSGCIVPNIVHQGYSIEDPRQNMVKYAYTLGGLDLVTTIECENGSWNPKAKGDRGHSHGLCQMNDRYHKIPKEYFEDWVVQVEYCYNKRITGTKFYAPNRKIKGKKCSDYVLDRFTIKDEKNGEQ